MQHDKVHSASELSRHALGHLVTLWFAILFLTVAAALLVSANTAKAGITMPPRTEPVITRFLCSPTPVIIQERYSSHLHPQKHGVAQSDFPNRTQRNAENQGQHINA